ncbi:5257_t:CDS:2 [Funneliformis geosporum]|uniref:2820_t:CDS:1 n=1 Tax=Funneliformis geosporum TaxID=1117311 RepID=A0A9W4SHC8_9GLOM|nr:5257_t:CDS:2 [Funneliformis geosporum]CAI2169144.1 2820_t:CDS:2 [Funneliformis geosporum]
MDYLIIRRAEDAVSNGAVSLGLDEKLQKMIGLILAISSGVFIGSSFVFKKKGLIQAQGQAGSVAGQGHNYLSNGLWWTGMILMIIGEICNFVAYAFTQAILVTPLGALSVVISAILSSIFLKERLNFQGKIGCTQCIIGAIIIVLHAPNQHTPTDIEDFKRMFFAPGFLVYAILAILGSLVIIWKIAPIYGSKHMLVYIGICSLIGSLSVVTTQGLGTAILKTFQGNNQFTHWFLYVLMAFVLITLLTEINYLNKALNLFNTAMVTPVYYVTFTSLTIMSSAILSQGFEAEPKSVVTVVMGFLVICSGIVLLQVSKSTGLDSVGTIDSPTDADLADNRLSRVDYNPGAAEIRASFGSIRRYSMSAGKTRPTLPSHTIPTSIKEDTNRRTQSLNYGIIKRSSMRDSNLPTINEFDKNAARYSSTTTKSLGNPQIDPITLTHEKHNQSKNSIIRFFSSPISTEPEERNDTTRSHPIIHTTTPSFSSSSTKVATPQTPTKELQLNKENDGYYNELTLPPLPSPLQHPINYLKQHLSPTNSFILDNGSTINSESYSGTVRDNLRRQSSTSSYRRSQNTMSIVDRFKIGRNVGGGVDEQVDNEVHEGLVRDVSNRGSTGKDIR